jgi:hypothetical protein
MMKFHLAVAGIVAAALAAASPALGDPARIGRIEISGGMGACGPIGDLNRPANLGFSFPLAVGVRITRNLLLGIDYLNSEFSTSHFGEQAEMDVLWIYKVTRTGVWARYLFPKSIPEARAGTGQYGFFVSAGAASYKVKPEITFNNSVVFEESKPGLGFNIGGGLYLFSKTRRVLQGWGLALGLSLHHVQMDEPYALAPAPAEVLAQYDLTGSEATFLELNIVFSAHFGR